MLEKIKTFDEIILCCFAFYILILMLRSAWFVAWWIFRSEMYVSEREVDRFWGNTFLWPLIPFILFFRGLYDLARSVRNDRIRTALEKKTIDEEV